jgi:hypothetical protein
MRVNVNNIIFELIIESYKKKKGYDLAFTLTIALDRYLLHSQLVGSGGHRHLRFLD